MKSNYQNRFPYNKYQSASYYFSLGIEQHKLGNYFEAIKHYTTAIKFDSNSVGSYNNRGIAKASIGHYEAAISDFKITISKDPKHKDAYSNLALAKSKLHYASEVIIEDCNQAIQINPKNVEAYSIRASEYQKQGKFIEAISDCNQALSINPDFSEAFNNRGNVYWNLREFDKAISDYDQALRIDSQYPEAYINRGGVYLEKGLHKKAIASYCMAIPYSMGLLTTKQHYVKISELLKFRKIMGNTLISIQNSHVWFAHPDTFTDTEDGKYLVRRFPEHEDIKQVVSYVLVYSCFGMFLNEDNSPNEALIKNQNKMWADYGDGGKGICLHYQYNSEQATKADKYSFDKITYVEKIKQEENTSLFDTIQHGFFTKYSGFIFENEARFITMANENSKQGVVVTESDIGLNLVAIDFGIGCSQEDKQKVFDAVDARVSSGSITFYQLSHGNSGSFEFNKTKINR